MAKLSTRSYIVLGLLALGDWTTYELDQQMKRGFADIWSTSRSMVYEEPKQLVTAGLARAKVEQVGQRSRTRYGITRAGRATLRSWLAEPGAAPAMHFEGLLKVLLADTAHSASIEPSLAAAREWAAQMRRTGTQVATEYAAEDGPFQARVDVVGISFAFLWDFADLVERWAVWARDQVDSWPHRDPRDATAVFSRALEGRATIESRAAAAE